MSRNRNREFQWAGPKIRGKSDSETLINFMVIKQMFGHGFKAAAASK